MIAGRLRGRKPPWPMIRLGGLVIAAAIALTLLLPRNDGPAPRPTFSGSPGPTFNLPAALDAPVDEAGLMGTGGMWAVQGPYLLTSIDNGETWRAGSFPSPGSSTPAASVFVLDPLHAWAAGTGLSGEISGGASNDASGSAAPSPVASGRQLTVNRTSDGGQTWQSTPIAVNFRCDSATISFVDAERGFVMCSAGSSPGPSGSVDQSRAGATKGSGTVLRTVDGGASWSVAGGATGLGSQFIASDAGTLWSAPDHHSSTLSGAALYVSRDAGATWSSVSLPDFGSVAPNTEIDVQSGPVFWDASNGAFAVSVSPCCSVDSAEIWFYRTSDGGQTWSVVKKPRLYPLDPVLADNALVGKVWAVIGDAGLFSLTASDDFGASWADAPGFGMPDNSSFLSLAMADKDHGLATVMAFQGASALMLTADGGRTWHPADFGDARAKVPANSAQDPVTAKGAATDFETMALKFPPTAWNDLSSYSQRLFSGESAFEDSQGALLKRAGYAFQVGAPTRSTDVFSRASLGSPVWDDLIAFADMTRAYAVVVTFPDTAEPAQRLVVAPLSVTGDWRVWLVVAPPAASPSARAS